MTEKRFNLVPCYESFNGQKCLTGMAKLTDTKNELKGVVENDIYIGNMVDKLNELHEEKEELKKDLEETLQKKYTHYLDMQKTLGHNQYANSIYINILKVLKDTSEQLGVDLE